jgi:hypothetical protein
MSFSPAPAPYPWDAGQPAAAQEGLPAKTDPAGSIPSALVQGVSRPAGRTVPPSKALQEERTQKCPRGSRKSPAAAELRSPAFHVDVRWGGADPFLWGVLIGAIATIISFLIVLFFFLLSH